MTSDQYLYTQAINTLAAYNDYVGRDCIFEIHENGAGFVTLPNSKPDFYFVNFHNLSQAIERMCAVMDFIYKTEFYQNVLAAKAIKHVYNYEMASPDYLAAHKRFMDDCEKYNWMIDGQTDLEIIQLWKNVERNR